MTSAEMLERMQANAQRLEALCRPCNAGLLNLVGLQMTVATQGLEERTDGDATLIAALSAALLERCVALDERCVARDEERGLIDQALALLAEQGALYFAHAATVQMEAATAVLNLQNPPVPLADPNARMN